MHATLPDFRSGSAILSTSIAHHVAQATGCNDVLAGSATPLTFDQVLGSQLMPVNLA